MSEGTPPAAAGGGRRGDWPGGRPGTLLHPTEATGRSPRRELRPFGQSDDQRAFFKKEKVFGQEKPGFWAASQEKPGFWAAINLRGEAGILLNSGTRLNYRLKRRLIIGLS